jgi:hypothetical protein
MSVMLLYEPVMRLLTPWQLPLLSQPLSSCHKCRADSNCHNVFVTCILLFLSYQVSAKLLEPDLGLLTPPEMARKAGQIIYGIPTTVMILPH